MDPKKQGIVFEALTYSVLKDLKLDVHWGIKPKGFSIDPDFIIGPIDNPTHWLLVTSTGSAKNFDMKFWRNLAEIFLAKQFFSDPPRLVNLVFKQHQKPGLQEVLAQLCDGDLSVANSQHGATLIAAVSRLNAGFPKDKRQKVEKLREIIKKDSGLRAAYRALQVDVRRALESSKPELTQLWSRIRAAKGNAVPGKARITNIRRGIAKLMIAPYDSRTAIYKCVSSRKKLPVSTPSFLEDVGLIRKTIKGFDVQDQDVLSAIDLLGPDRIEQVIGASPTTKMQGWIDVLRHLPNNDLFINFIRSKYEELSTPSGMLEHLRNVYRNPYHGLRKNLVAGELSKHWLYDALCDCVKASAQKSQGFGYSKLIQTVFSETNRINQWLDECGMPPLQLRGRSVLIRGLTDWVNRKDTNHARSFSKSFQAAVAWILARELREIERDSLPTCVELKKTALNTILEKKLIPYRLFEPLALLIQQSLDAASISWKRHHDFPTFPGEYLGADSAVATTSLITAKASIIMWRSAPKNPRDKTKELASRIQALKIEYRAGRFLQRGSFVQAVLVVDGAFTNTNLKELARAGWDHILYADDLQRLPDIIV